MGEKEAVARLKQRDIGGLETLVRKYQVQAVRYAYLITADLPLAEDIVQTAFLRAYERIHQFDSSRPFGPWFLRSVINDAVKANKRQRRQVSLDRDSREEELVLAEPAPDPGLGPEELLERAEDNRTVREVLRYLSPPRRVAVVLRYYLEFTEPEIAERLEWPLGTVKRRLHDARTHLRVLLSAALADQAGRCVATRRRTPDPEPGAMLPGDGEGR